MFTILFMMPSAQHALLFGCDMQDIFQPSSRDLFKRGFPSNIQPMNRMWAQHLWIQPLPQSLSLGIPNSHFIDVDSFVISIFLIISLRFLEWLDIMLYQLAQVLRAALASLSALSIHSLNSLTDSRWDLH